MLCQLHIVGAPRLPINVDVKTSIKKSNFCTHLTYIFNDFTYTFSVFLVKYLKVHRRYPLASDGLDGQMKIAVVIVCLFPTGMFFLSMGDLSDPLFFANCLSVDLLNVVKNFLPLRILLSLLEASIALYSWGSNIHNIFFIFTFAIFFKFWCEELNAHCPSGQLSQKGSPLRRLEETMRVYRQLQLLMTQFNNAYSDLIKNFCVSAFVNQVCVNYVTVKLRGEVAFLSWLACSYLSIIGAFNVLTAQNAMAFPYETSGDMILSWRIPKAFKREKQGLVATEKYKRCLFTSCPQLKLKYGSFRVMKKDNGIEWVDSLIDSTVTLILWE